MDNKWIAMSAALALTLIGALGPRVGAADNGGPHWEDVERYGDWRPVSRIEGLWNVNVKIHPLDLNGNCNFSIVITSFEAMGMFAANGTFHDTNASTQGFYRSDAFGIWRHNGHRKYRFAFRTFLFTPAGLPNGSQIVRHDVELAPDAKSYQSQGTAQFFDVNGAEIVGRRGCSTSTATRFG
jgi:hypothetical protein